MAPTPAGVLPCPELDDGEGFKGRAILSARLWLPHTLGIGEDLVNQRSSVQPRVRYDPRPLMKKDGVTVKDARGQPLRWGKLDIPTINMMGEHKHHVSIPRYLVPELMDEIAPERLDFSPVWESVDFQSTLAPRDAKQQRSWDALESVDHGTLNLACGLGKTCLGLMKVAQRGVPAIILVHNGGLAYQWKARALQFFDIEEQDIGLIQGSMGKSEFVFVPGTTTGLVDEFRRLDFEVIRVQERLMALGAGVLLVTNKNHLIEHFCGVLGLDCRSISPMGKVSLRGADLEHWAAGGVEEAHLVLQQLDLQRQFKTLRKTIGGERPHWMRKLVIAMIPSLANKAVNLPMAFRQRFGTVLFDEAHHLPATTFSKTTDLFFGERYSLTATPEREDELESIMFAHTGGVFYRDMEPEVPAEIYIKTLPTSIDLEQDDVAEAVLDKRGKLSIPLIHQYFSSIDDRNRRILNFVKQALVEDRRILVLVWAESHPHNLLRMFREMGTDWTACAVTGQTDPKDRTDLLSQHDVTFATTGVAREGLDAPCLDTVIFASPFSAWSILVQGKGRIERKRADNKTRIAIILEDEEINICKGMIWSLRHKMRRHGIEYNDSTG